MQTQRLGASRQGLSWMLYGAGAITGAGILAAFTWNEAGFLAWVAFIPLLAAIRQAATAREAGHSAAVAGLIFYGIGLSWFYKVFGPMAAGFWCVFALWMVLHAVLLWWVWHHWVAPNPSRCRQAVWALLAGLLWVGVEYFRCEVWWLANSFLALGYSQSASLPFLQFASLGGVYGLSALIVIVNAFFSIASRRHPWPGFIAAGLLATVGLWGQARLHRSLDNPTTPRWVALIQDESFNVDRLIALSSQEGVRKADILVWPEYGFLVPPGGLASYQKWLCKRLEGLPGMRIVSGAVIPGANPQGRKENFTWVFDSSNQYLGRYDKHHPIPYVEKKLTPNKSVKPIETPLGRIGIQICYDLDFEDGTRSLVRQGAELLVVPNLDPDTWGFRQHRQHSQMAPFRALESGLWLTRAASSGMSQVIDPRGRVRASLGFGESGVLFAPFAFTRSGTIYSRGGWVVGPLCLILTLVILMGFMLNFTRFRLGITLGTISA